MVKLFFRFFSCLVFFVSSLSVASTGSGIGDIAGNFVAPVRILSEAVINASILIGIIFCAAAFLRYMQYRTNPLASSLGGVFFLLILGLVLICFPLIYKFS